LLLLLLHMFCRIWKATKFYHILMAK
jgi:hypothetical protein